MPIGRFAKTGGTHHHLGGDEALAGNGLDPVLFFACSFMNHAGVYSYSIFHTNGSWHRIATIE
jgi:hypothetical protein